MGYGVIRHALSQKVLYPGHSSTARFRYGRDTLILSQCSVPSSTLSFYGVFLNRLIRPFFAHTIQPIAIKSYAYANENN